MTYFQNHRQPNEFINLTSNCSSKTDLVEADVDTTPHQKAFSMVEETWENCLTSSMHLPTSKPADPDSGQSCMRIGSKACFIYILDSSNSSSITFWTSKFSSSSKSNWTSIWPGISNGSWTDKQSSLFSTAKEMSVKAIFFFMKKPQQTNFEMMLKCCWNPAELVICKWWFD